MSVRRPALGAIVLCVLLLASLSAHAQPAPEPSLALRLYLSGDAPPALVPESAPEHRFDDRHGQTLEMARKREDVGCGQDRRDVPAVAEAADRRPGLREQPLEIFAVIGL